MSNLKSPESLDEALNIIQSQQVEIDGLRRELVQLRRASGGEFSAKQLVRRLYGAAIASRRVLLLAQSPFFDAKYYADQVGSAKPFRTVRHAARHYLKVGAAKGLNPSEDFDTQWYLAKYPDVGASGHNPLVHFILYGLDEGRLPGPQGLDSRHLVRKEPTRSSELSLKAWGGFANLALPKLERLANNHFDAQAAWALAKWYYAHGDFDEALHRVQQCQQLRRRGLSKRVLVALTKCYAQLGLQEETQRLVAAGLEAGLSGIDFPYVRANAALLAGDFDEALVAFNEVYTRAGMDPVAVDPSVGIEGHPLSWVTGGSRPMEMGALPKVSVVIPAFNAANTLSIALRSLLAQTWQNLEIIVVDDCSQDGTHQVVESFANADKRVCLIRNAVNQGAYPSRNRGMASATGEFVTVHDSDDWSHPQKIERQIQPLLADLSKVATYSSWVRVTKDLLFVGPWLLSEHFVEKNHSSLLVRASVLEEAGFWDAVNVAGDTEFLWRLEARYGVGSTLGVLPTTPLSLALADDNSLTRTKASHVKTIHYGLRRLYREAAQWWHRQEEGRPVLRQSERPFPVPLGIVRDSPRHFDEVWVANFSDSDVSETLKELENRLSENGQVCLVHWPDYLGWYKTPVQDAVFEFCARLGIHFAHPGLEIEARTLVMAGKVPMDYPPSEVVKIRGLVDVSYVAGCEVEASLWLVDYFSSGGSQSLEKQI